VGRKETKQRIEEREERLNKNSKNSSMPPSKNGFGVNADKKGKAKRKPSSDTRAAERGIWHRDRERDNQQHQARSK
jgi:hypothetical protein